MKNSPDGENIRKATKPVITSFVASPKQNRGDWIRTSDLYVPNVALYQPEPHPEVKNRMLRFRSIRRPCQGTTDRGLEPLLTESESAVLPITPIRIMLSSDMCYYNRTGGKINPLQVNFAGPLLKILQDPRAAVDQRQHLFQAHGIDLSRRGGFSHGPEGDRRTVKFSHQSA